MKKKKILLILAPIIIGVISMITSILNVNAGAYDDKIYLGENVSPAQYIHRLNPSKGRNNAIQEKILRRTSDNQYVYCIEIGAPVDEGILYNSATSNWWTHADISQATWQRIRLLAYYGYGYNANGYNHTASRWYGITQTLIHRAIGEPDGWTINWTDTLWGNVINPYNSEIAELNALVDAHYVRPSFQNSNHVMYVGESITITDANGVLSLFSVNNNPNISVSKNGNNLTITANEIANNTTLTLTKTDSRFSIPPIVYYHANSQKAMSVGAWDPVSIGINLEIRGGKVTINKLDRDTQTATPQGEALLSNAVYGIYKNDVKITTITTDANGKATSGFLPSIGTFYLLEETPSKGYQLDPTKYYFDITTEQLNPTVNLYESIIAREIEIIKLLSNGGVTGALTPEININFGFYDKDNNKVAEGTTNAKGYLKVKLPYGTYTVKQLNTTPNHEKVEDFVIVVHSVGEPYTYVLSNANTQAKLKVVKVDEETGKTIPLSGIKFRIFDIDNNEYVVQKITYPSPATLSSFSTNENGELVTPYPLPSGNYQLEEIDQLIPGYLWNSNPLLFSITDSEDYIYDEDYGIMLEVKFSNKEVKGSLEINKKGQEVLIENGNFKYIEIDLPEVKYELYASKDIVSAYGQLIYKKGDLVGTIKTNKTGYASIDDLYLGSYYLVEVESSNNNAINKEKIEFTLEYKDQHTPVIELSKELKNKYKTGSLEFTKTDLTSGKAIPDTLVEIYHIGETEELIFSGKTDKAGKIIITNLFVGKFKIIERVPATGYRISDEEVFFEIKEDGEIIKANMTNEKVHGKLEFTKIDISTGEPLPNTLVEIYLFEDGESSLIFSGRTDENGKIIIDALEYGRYYILEKEAPKGYQINTDKMWFEILEEGQIVKATMDNHKIPIPNTLLNDYTIYACVVFILVGGVALLYGKRK